MNDLFERLYDEQYAIALGIKWTPMSRPQIGQNKSD